MSTTPSTPTWTAPKLIELRRADQAQAGISYSSQENATYSPSAPA
jgi:hypothetical protein